MVMSMFDEANCHLWTIQISPFKNEAYRPVPLYKYSLKVLISVNSLQHNLQCCYFLKTYFVGYEHVRRSKLPFMDNTNFPVQQRSVQACVLV